MVRDSGFGNSIEVINSNSSIGNPRCSLTPPRRLGTPLPDAGRGENPNVLIFHNRERRDYYINEMNVIVLFSC